MELRPHAEKYRLRKLRSATKDSLRLWDIALRMLDRYLGRPAELRDLDNDTFAGFCQWRRQTVSAGTLNRDLGTLLALWRWLHRTGVVDRWPEVPLDPEPTRTPQAWTRDEFCRLMHVASKMDDRIGSVPGSYWWTALLLVLFDSAERIRAVLSLEWDQVDVEGGWILFRAESRKGQRADSICRIAPDTQQAMANLRKHAERKPFDWPFCGKYIWVRYGKLLKRAGLPNDRHRKFHCVRRTTASHLEAAGGNATDALRHSSRRVTLAYLDPRIVQPSQPIDLLWRPE